MSRLKHSKKSVFWQQVFKEFEESKLSVAEFCKQKELSLQSFYQWRRRFKSQQDAPTGTHTLIPVTIVPSPQPVKTSVIQLTTNSGACLRFNSDVPASHIAELLAAIDGSSRGDA
jgi:transposase-like protein